MVDAQQLPAFVPVVCVDGVGRLGLPLCGGQARELRDAGAQLSASLMNATAAWPGAEDVLAAVVACAAASLGALPDAAAGMRLELRGFALWWAGDTVPACPLRLPLPPGAWGQLGLLLPSVHTGGRLRLTSGGMQLSVELGAPGAGEELRWVAWRRGTEVTTAPLLSGARAMLLYNLIPVAAAGGQLPPPLPGPAEVEAPDALLAEVETPDALLALVAAQWPTEGPPCLLLPLSASLCAVRGNVQWGALPLPPREVRAVQLLLDCPLLHVHLACLRLADSEGRESHYEGACWGCERGCRGCMRGGVRHMSSGNGYGTSCPGCELCVYSSRGDPFCTKSGCRGCERCYGGRKPYHLRMLRCALVHWAHPPQATLGSQELEARLASSLPLGVRPAAQVQARLREMLLCGLGEVPLLEVGAQPGWLESHEWERTCLVLLPRTRSAAPLAGRCVVLASGQ